MPKTQFRSPIETAAAEGFEVLRVLKVLKRAQNVSRRVSKLNRNSLLCGLGKYHGKAGAEPSKAAAEGFEVLMVLKVLRLLKRAQNVPSRVSKPTRNSLWGLGRYHGKAGAEPSKAAAESFDVLRVLRL